MVACLAADEDGDVQPQSALLLTMVEGALLLDAAGKPDLAELAVNDAASGLGPFVRRRTLPYGAPRSSWLLVSAGDL
jgi:hypothetical protein